MIATPSGDLAEFNRRHNEPVAQARELAQSSHEEAAQQLPAVGMALDDWHQQRREIDDHTLRRP